MQTDVSILSDSVVERSRFPGIGKEYHADSLAKVVELEPCYTNGRQDGGIRDASNGYFKLSST